MQNLVFFLRLFNWFSLRHIRKHRLQAALVLLGIALGAAVFTSVRLSIHGSCGIYKRETFHSRLPGVFY
jgi:putative ABC transport system permease protein